LETLHFTESVVQSPFLRKLTNQTNKTQIAIFPGAKERRASIARYIDAATNLSVTVDTVPIKDLRRVKSEVFAARTTQRQCVCKSLPAARQSTPARQAAYILLA